MKMLTAFMGSLLMVFATAASAQDYKACQTTYKSTVEACAKSLGGYEPALRAGFQKACVKDAQLKRDMCLNGGPNEQCLATCQQLYDGEAQVCEATYQTNYLDCGGNLTCRNIITLQRDECLLTAVGKLNTCTQGCMTTP